MADKCIQQFDTKSLFYYLIVVGHSSTGHILSVQFAMTHTKSTFYYKPRGIQ